jgi:ABC-type sugar transport system substrate-binding protein
MRKSLSLALFVVSLLSAAGARAQSPNFNVGPVWRVTYFHIKSGQGDAFWNDVRQHGKPVLEEQKKQGLISDYKFYTNPVLNNPGDWDVALAVSYPNWAAIDQLAAKGFSIAEKHYGSREAMTEAGRKRDEIRDVVASHLAREVTPK